MIYLTSLFYFFYFSVIGVYIIFLPKVLEQSGYSASQIGIIFSAAPLVRFLVPLLFIRGFELNKSAFFTALVILFVSVSAMCFSLYNFYALLLSNIFFGIGLSLILPYVELISLHEIGKERYGKSRLFGSIGFMAVALILVHFLENPENALNSLFILSVATIIIAIFVVNHASPIHNERNDQKNGISLLKDWQLWLGFALMQVSFGAFYNFFTIYETAHGISMQTTIYLWSFGVLIEIVMLYFQGKLLQKNLLLILQLSIVATALRWFLVFAFADTLWVMFLAQSLHALSFALFHSAAISYLFVRYHNKALAQQLFSGISYGLGSLVGAILAGYIYEYLPNYLFLISSIIALFAFWSLHLFQKSTSKLINKRGIL
ncbi:putative MFS metabolite transporter [hydrothermal vent metagenome]|uniref:Putative MFS metabolite transporter n=1 Tax=hydrothermal vent metagenome TaxID=652676 RepID=A0A1W1B8K5_9ZZZZ